MLPDEIISEILSPALKVPEELFSDTSDVSPFSNYAPSTSAYLVRVVCKDWLRVATPLLYNVVVLRSTAQANALAIVLKQNPEFGRFVKKLRVEGGYGIILKATPEITDLFLSLAIWASDNTSGLCKGLPLVNPHRVILVDPWVAHPLKNQQLEALRPGQTVMSCLGSWKNMRIFNHPYGSRIAISNPVWAKRALEIQKALVKSRVHTITLSSTFTMIPRFIYSLCDIPSLQVLQFPRPLEEHAGRLVGQINGSSRLKKLAKYTLYQPLSEHSAAYAEPDITPSLNPNFTPMQSAPEETRERVWKRVLFFAMYVEELRSPSFSRSPTESHPSRLPILSVSTYFHSLALPYLCECVLLTPQSASGIQRRLQEQPHLGSFIRRIFTTSEQFSSSIRDATRYLFRHAINLEVFIPATHDRRQRISTEAFDLLAKTAGHSLRELSATMDSVSASSLKSFTALRVLEIGGFKLCVSPTGFPPDALKTLHTLHIHCAVLGSILGIFASASKLVQVHGQKLQYLTIDSPREFPVLYLCPNLLELEILADCDLVKLTPRVPHNSLFKIIVQFVPTTIKEMEFDPAMFPALREIQIRDLKWPTNERDISKSRIVPLAESLFQRNIKLTNDEGKHWVPRLKTGRVRKG
ncbi:hypothetical protein FB45DRAFT_1078824 [Roridomyces roridus]|uniref:Uncharacterized protein n=1 Tax=Roridomyces roridus TaxID=1738132 RepID=A0AAD7CKV8_9AGAR|nr:hypothetical protein FB45DRAFT_1078824 [Roridomyces roridus]